MGMGDCRAAMRDGTDTTPDEEYQQFSAPWAKPVPILKRGGWQMMRGQTRNEPEALQSRPAFGVDDSGRGDPLRNTGFPIMWRICVSGLNGVSENADQL